MKIAVATDDFSTVTGHIGRCRGFIIYEVDNDKIINKVEKENSFTNHHGEQHHHGHHEENHNHSHSRLVDALKGCSHLICTNAGWRVVEDLKQNNIQVVFTNESNADLAAIKLSTGKLVINEDGVCTSN